MENKDNNDLPGFTYYLVRHLVREYPSGRRERVYCASPRYERHMATKTKRQCVREAARMGHRAVFVG